jgi:dTDP-D-glucose 4,6-dehydratase
MHDGSILVTGGAGFIGSNFVRQWLATEDTPVVNLDKLTYSGNIDNIRLIFADPHHRFVHGDICDRGLVRDLLKDYQPAELLAWRRNRELPSHDMRLLVSTFMTTKSLKLQSL